MKNRIIDYFILFVGGCLIFTVVGGMVVGLLKLIQITAGPALIVTASASADLRSIRTKPMHPLMAPSRTTLLMN